MSSSIDIQLDLEASPMNKPFTQKVLACRSVFVDRAIMKFETLLPPTCVSLASSNSIVHIGVAVILDEPCHHVVVCRTSATKYASL